MKKVWDFMLSVLVIIGCTGCASVISYSEGTPVQIIYESKIACYEKVTFDLELSQEEADVVLSVLNGKKRDYNMTQTGAGCGFGREQAFIIYCLALDGDSIIWEEGTKNY